MEDTGQCHRSGGDAAKRQYYCHRQRQKYGWNGQCGLQTTDTARCSNPYEWTRVVAGDELLYEHFMDKELLKRLLSYGEEREIAVGLTIDDKDYFVNPAEVERIDKIRWGESMRNFQDPWKMLELPVRTLAYIGEADPGV